MLLGRPFCAVSYFTEPNLPTIFGLTVRFILFTSVKQIMSPKTALKYSLLSLALGTAGLSAEAATVYNKNGTSLGINGRIQSVFYSNNYNLAGDHDSSIHNSARFGLRGKVRINKWASALAYAQWDMNSTGEGNGAKAREQYVGVDFNSYGVLTAGKFRDASYYAESVTDNYEQAAGTLQGHFDHSRRPGQFMYTYENYGFHGQLGLQTAQDRVALLKNKFNNLGSKYKDSWDIDSGFSSALGYTFDDVWFGPLSVRTGYSYIKGQTGRDIKNRAFINFKHAAAGISWGNISSGFYAAALYDYCKVNFKANDWLKIKGFEISGGYAFDSGISILTGYEAAWFEEDRSETHRIKRIPLLLKYKLNPNFSIWSEAGFNAGSDHKQDFGAKKYTKRVDRSVFSLGARYTF